MLPSISLTGAGETARREVRSTQEGENVFGVSGLIASSFELRTEHSSLPHPSEALIAGSPWYNAQMMLRRLWFARLCRIPLALFHLLERAHGAMKSVSVVAVYSVSTTAISHLRQGCLTV